MTDQPVPRRDAEELAEALDKLLAELDSWAAKPTPALRSDADWPKLQERLREVDRVLYESSNPARDALSRFRSKYPKED